MSSQQPPTLYRGWPEKSCYVWSPFVTKVEFHLRYSKITHNIETGSTRSSPKGKVPYINLGTTENPEMLSDSTIIINRLAEVGKIPNLNASLSADQKLQDLAIRALLEDKLYFYNMHERWLKNYYTHRDKTLYAIPWPMRIYIGSVVHSKIVQTLNGQGTGRHSDQEIFSFVREVWQTLDEALAVSKSKSSPDAPFWVLGGSSPTEADASLFGFVTSALVATSGPESKKIVQGFPTVMEYADRIHERYFSDYEKWS